MTLGKGRSSLWIAAACVATWGVTLAGGFVYDDIWTVVQNPFITDAGNLPRLVTGDLPANLPDGPRPSAVASAMLDYALWGLDPFGWHLQNLLWHLACALGVASLARGLAEDERVALAAGLLFTVHAVQAEVVAAVNYREDLIVTAAMVFGLLSVRRGRAVGRSGWIWLACLLLVLGTNAKETVVLFPPLLLLHDLCFRQGLFAERSWRATWPYLPLASACLASRFWISVLSGSAPLTHTQGAVGLEPLPLLFTEGAITLAYLEQLVLPLGLSAEYATPVIERLNAAASAGLLLIAGIAVLGVWSLGRRPALGFGLLWFLVCLLPTANIVPIENLRADRYLYLPAVGFCLAVGWLLARLADRLSPRQATANRVFAVLLACVCLVYGLLAVQRARVWRSDLTLWRHTVEQVPTSLRARLGLMSAYQRAGRLDEALAVGREIAELAPENWKLRMNLGIVYTRQRRPQRALKELRLAQELGGEDRPELADALAAAHFQAGHVQQAIAVLAPAVESHPSDSRLLLSLGKLQLAAGHYGAGIATLERTARLRPGDPELPRLLAKAWLRQGDLDAAAQSARRAVELQPGDPRNAALLERIERRGRP